MGRRGGERATAAPWNVLDHGDTLGARPGAAERRTGSEALKAVKVGAVMVVGWRGEGAAVRRPMSG